GIAVYANEDNESAMLDESELEIVRSQPFVESAAAIKANGCPVLYRGETLDSVIWEVRGNAGDVIALELLYGRMTDDSDAGTKVCMVDTAVAQQIYQRDNIVGKSISVLYDGEVQKLEVVGVVEAGSGLLDSFMGSVVPSFIYVAPDTIKSKHSGSDQFVVKIKDGEDPEKCRQGIADALTNSQLHPERDYTTADLARQRNALNSIINTVTLVLTLVGGISLFVAGIGIMTVMTISVSERLREIGIKMAIGARRIRILMEFLLEGLFISAIGCIAGTAMGYLLEYLISVFAGISITISAPTILTSSLIAVFIGIIFSAMPAFRAASLDPAEALKTGD
ncbi:MAG: ABC transporter permease, partial [Clostridia bacterium]|nr:ABC transporter permease [Clostridia bacterium]